MRPSPSTIERLLEEQLGDVTKPVAIVLAGHNGSGKSTLWYERLANRLQIPLVNADRLTMSVLPEPAGKPARLPEWAQSFRDENRTWQALSQSGVRLFRQLIVDQRQAFGFETVFSHWEPRPDGSHESKIDDIKALQQSGYAVVLVFVGLTALPLSIARVQSRRRTGGHDVPIEKLTQRFPRTQQAIGAAAKVADLTLMVDNSLEPARAFQFVRAQRKRKVLFDIRDPRYEASADVRAAASPWLGKVVGAFRN